MKVIVDANIVFSGILNSNGKIGFLLINSSNYLRLIAPEFLRYEILKHHSRLCKISGLTSRQIREAEFLIFKDIIFISEEQIRNSDWIIAEKLVAGVDPNDVHYIAYAKHFRCKIWSGDKELVDGLNKKGFTNFISTDELYKWRLEKESKS